MGHLYKDCFHPIMSFGIICFREWEGKLEYIMIQRKDSLCFMEFIRGKYEPSNIKYIKDLFRNMTASERALILTSSFEDLWNQVWFQPFIPRHTQEFTDAKRKFDCLNTRDIIDTTTSPYLEPEWGFPKGRRRLREHDVDCAIREFSEETGFSRDDIALIDNQAYEEVFYGTNNILYRHVYYLALLHKNQNKNIIVDPANIHQAREVRKIEWYKYKDADALIRPHNQERKYIFAHADLTVRFWCKKTAFDAGQEAGVAIP